MRDATIIPDSTQQAALGELVERYGEGIRERARKGIVEIARAWRESDGSADDFAGFVKTRFVGNDEQRVRLLGRVEDAQLQLGGHLGQMRRALSRWRDVDVPDDPGIDKTLAAFSPTLDLSEEMYRQELAFVILLNFPRFTLKEKLQHGAAWSMDEWAAARVADAVPRRLPHDLNDLGRVVHRRAQEFSSTFHIPVGCVTDAAGRYPFGKDRKLLAHWTVRDELRNAYGDPDGGDRQRLLATIMGRHINGTIPRAVMGGTAKQWCPFANTVDGSVVNSSELVGPERYAVWHALFGLARTTDPHFPDYPTQMERSLELGMELTVEDVERLLRDVLSAPVRGGAAAFVSARLGRKLEAFDIYVRDLAPPEPSAVLNRAVRERFPTFEAFETQMPAVLRELGFAGDTADFLSGHIRVERARGCGHASPPPLAEYPALLRTHHVNGMLDWPALAVTMHELGHCVEQVFGFHRTPRKALRGVPNSACTEAFAFSFEHYARRIAGIPYPEQHAELSALSDLLMTAEIAGPGLVDLLSWRWLYANPAAGAADLRDATMRIAADVWQEYFEPYYGPDTNRLLAAYQHMISTMLYLPNYTIGHLIAHQVRRHVTDETFAAEVERICSLGRLTPAHWMEQAVGRDVSAEPLIASATEALDRLPHAR